MSDTKLLDALFACGAVRVQKPGDPPFTLKSGAASDVYVDVRCVVLRAGTLRTIVSRLCGLLVGTAYDSIGCDDGPGPMVLLGALLEKREPGWMQAFVRRKTPTSHGTANEVEGVVGKSPVIIEDVITTGGSVEGIVRAIGVQPVAVVCVVDRRAADAPALPWPVHSLLTLADVREYAARATFGGMTYEQFGQFAAENPPPQAWHEQDVTALRGPAPTDDGGPEEAI
jgi:orotate phosphoribosyltransferase